MFWRWNRDADPAEYLRHIMDMSHLSRSLYTAVRLGVGDALSDGPLASERLARRCGADQRMLEKLMTFLAVNGVFLRDASGAWALNPVGELLRQGQFGAALIDYMGSPPVRNSFGNLEFAVRDGGIAFEAANGGRAFWDFLEKGLDRGIWDQFQLQLQRRRAPGVADALRLGDADRIVDVGCGAGDMLAEILKRHPGARGTGLDVARLEPAFLEVVAEAGLQGRMAFVAGDLFDGVPAGADAYLLALMLDHWPEMDAVKMLRMVSTAMTRASRLFIIERVRGEPWSDQAADTDFDLRLALLQGGRIRSRAEHATLSREAGLRLMDVRGDAAPFTVIEVAKE